MREPEPLNAEFFCTSCRTPFLNPRPLDEEGRCARCRLGITGYDSAYAYGAYDGALRKLIHVFKYEKVKPLAKPLGRLLSLSLPREQRFDMIVPMPLHWRRLWSRGFNQSELLARVLSKATGVPVAMPIRRRRSTSPQAGLSSAKRRTNVSGAFSLKRGKSVQGLRILLVDDVLTTGATAAACALILKRAGALHVSVIALARVDRRVAILNLDREPILLSVSGSPSR